ncbi:MAG: PDZ domain-containing protein [Alphaproteobacteria bacterium]|nr:PDZ domain-containing protein [Alphaproteobacteria bacterium]
MWRSLAILVAAAGVASCLSADGTVPAPAAALPGRDVSAARVMLASYRAIADRYIEDRDFRVLTVDTVRGAASLDPQLRLDDLGATLRLSAGDQVLLERAAPGSPHDARAWAEIAAEMVEILTEATPLMKDATRDRVVKAALDATTKQLDKNSRYSDPQEARDNRFNREGAGGIGVTVQAENDTTVVTAVQDGAPAATAGIKPGDRIVGVDSERVAGKPMRDIVRTLRGRIGEPVTVVVFRPSAGTELSFALRRQLIIPTTVSLERRGDVALIKLTGFNSGTTETLRNVLQKLKAEPSGALGGIILDMRGNPGGLLDQAISVSELLLDNGLLLTTDGRHPDSRQTFRSGNGALLEGVPMVVIMNGRSASAAEIVGAALQDRGRAILVGSASYGKGTVQTVVRLPNEGELTLTWSRMHAPSGYAWHELGILPTVCTARFGGPDTLPGELDARAQAVRMTMAEWHATRKLPAERVSRLRATCPPVDDMPAKDIELAERLLHDRPLYARALNYAAGAIAERR